jgi:hypothetical protein
MVRCAASSSVAGRACNALELRRPYQARSLLQSRELWQMNETRLVRILEQMEDFSVSNISVQFTNETPIAVGFFLNGGAGLETSLGPGVAQSYSMVVDPGVPPLVGIHQSTQERLDFSVADHGNYAFRFLNGKIVNSFV